MKTRKSRLSFALQAALVGGAVATMPTIASAVVSGSLDEQGNALVFPYYTANGGWTTLFNITNTAEAYLALKIRFREQENSRDVLDFNVVMSPKDVWTGWVGPGPNGPRFFTRDSSCTSPILPVNDTGASYADFSSVAYTGSASDGGSTGIERAAEGHLEVFVMGAIGASQGGYWAPNDPGPNYPTAYWSDHAHMDCSIVDANFKVNSGDSYSAVAPSASNNATNTPQDALAGNPQARYDFTYTLEKPLIGHVSYINTGRGVGAGGDAFHFDRFGESYEICENELLHSSESECNLVTAQEYPYFLEPTLASDKGLWTWDVQRGKEGITARNLTNEWSVNEKTGASTDWIVSFPEKYLHVDIYDEIQAGANLVRLAYAAALQEWGGGPCESTIGGYACNGGSPQSTLAGALLHGGALASVLAPFSEPFDGQSCDEVVFNLYDREENGVRGGGTSISPAPPVPASSLCYETNVITFGGARSVLESRLAQTIDVSGLVSGASAGFMHMEVARGELEDGPTRKPVAGFALKERNFGDPTRNYGQLMNHSLEDPWEDEM